MSLETGLYYYCEFVGGRGAHAWVIRQESAAHRVVDYFSSGLSAEHAVALLNGGLAQVEPHRPLGCRVQPVRATRVA